MLATDEAIILAGGFGTRLQSVVRDVPKPLAPVAGRPFLAWLLDQLAGQGVRRAVLATGYLADVVESTLGSDWHGMKLVYSREEQPLGTGGAIAKAASAVSGKRAFVLNGDTHLALDYARLGQLAIGGASPITMALASVDDVGRYGAVMLSGDRVTGFSEKGGHGPGMINAGVYDIDLASLSAEFPHGPFSFEQDVLVPAAAKGRVRAFTQTSRFIDIGIPEDFERAQSMFSQSLQNGA
ncbi:MULTISPECIES: nucleotidyltransferase family protein [Dyella]|uniref:Nucleotidyl transferase domain-containing protein n=2 Tax=Dyella TaxID=231454 RepID=A0A4V2NM63_9GAMM|nr:MULTISPECIES: nucleotidyltransferase family protein [Dyella]TBR40361.1 hypothetical protein EYV96_09420 [Dyella terrae]TCI12057.1 hypothetical protein EZM97_01450 [Dyella soli]